MGDEYSKTFTEIGVKRLSQYFIINVIGILIGFLLITTALGLVSYLNYENFYTVNFAYTVLYLTMILLLAIVSIWLVFSGTYKYYLIALFLVLYAFCYFPMISGFCILGMKIMFILLLFFILGSGLVNLLIGSKEFGTKQRIFATIAFFLGIASFILIIYNILWPILFYDLFLSIITVQLSPSLYLFTDVIINPLVLNSIFINVILIILINLAFLLFIFNLSKRKITLLIAFVLGVFSPVTFSITGIISLFLFILCYKDVQGYLHTDKIKPKLKASCPFCNREIPIESTSCKYCGKIFNIDPEYEKFKI